MANYAIMRIEKRKLGAVGRICKHNERLKTEYKSNPDIYLYTAEKLGVRSEDCVVFEDAKDPETKEKLIKFLDRFKGHEIQLRANYSFLTLENVFDTDNARHSRATDGRPYGGSKAPALQLYPTSVLAERHRRGGH